MRTILKLPYLTPLLVLCASLLGGCGQLDAPTVGTYRAYVKVRGGEVPFELQITRQNGATALTLLHGDETAPATGVQIKEGQLQSELPDGIGALQAQISKNQLKGELKLTDPQGKLQALPFAADLNSHYRFVEKPGTDNADVSGYWQLEAISPEHFATPVTLQLQQQFDAVDGQLKLPDGKLIHVLGQVDGDTVYLSVLGQGRAVLMQGKVNTHGELQGELWTNLSTANTWIARRMSDEAAALEQTPDTQVRQVALPWAIPAQ